MSAETLQHAVVLLSGGLDSATTLAIARDAGFICHALSFDYGQRHRHELHAAKRVAEALGAVEHRIATIDLRLFGGSALTANIDVPKDREGLSALGSRPSAGTDQAKSQQPKADSDDDIPITYVPARNTIFLSFALAYAETIEADHIFIGVNAVDYSGYPDCRPAYIEAFQNMASLATKRGVQGHRLTIHTPLIEMTKAQIIQRGAALGVDYGLTLSCYDPVVDSDGGVRHCGHCDSCLLRAEGFRQAGVADPAVT